MCCNCKECFGSIIILFAGPTVSLIYVLTKIKHSMKLTEFLRWNEEQSDGWHLSIICFLSVRVCFSVNFMSPNFLNTLFAMLVDCMSLCLCNKLHVTSWTNEFFLNTANNTTAYWNLLTSFMSSLIFMHVSIM